MTLESHPLPLPRPIRVLGIVAIVGCLTMACGDRPSPPAAGERPSAGVTPLGNAPKPKLLGKGDPSDSGSNWSHYFANEASKKTFSKELTGDQVGAAAPVEKVVVSDGELWTEGTSLIIVGRLTVHISGERPGEWKYVDAAERSWVLGDKIKITFPSTGYGTVELLSPKAWRLPKLTRAGAIGFFCGGSVPPSTLWLQGRVSFLRENQLIQVGTFTEVEPALEYFAASVQPAWPKGKLQKVWLTAYKGEPRVNLRYDDKNGADLGTLDLK